MTFQDKMNGIKKTKIRNNPKFLDDLVLEEPETSKAALERIEAAKSKKRPEIEL